MRDVLILAPDDQPVIVAFYGRQAGQAFVRTHFDRRVGVRKLRLGDGY